MSIRSNCVAAAAGALAGAAALTVFGLGPLDPPNGPITGTYKTLAEVEPRTPINAANTPGDANSVFRLATPGSYYLAGAFNVPSGRHGIEIAGSNITVDLNGFGVLGLNGSLDGINVSGALSAITIRNGAITGPGGDGINAVNASAVRIEGVTISGSAGQGIVVGATSELANCTVQDSGSHGINTGNLCRVTACTATGNGGIGIDVDNDSVVRDCIAGSNATDGITANDGCTVTNCIATGNTGNGINTGDTCIASGCVGRLNGAAGIDTDRKSLLQGSAAGDNSGNGISADGECLVTGCASGANLVGILATDSFNYITGCMAAGNSFRGIEFDSYSYIKANCSPGNCTGILEGGSLYTDGLASRVDDNFTHSHLGESALRIDGGYINDVMRNSIVGEFDGQGDGSHWKWDGVPAWNNPD